VKAILATILAILALASALSEPARLAYTANSRTPHPSVVIANADGSGAHALGPGGNPLLAPDGSQVAAIEIIGTRQAASEVLDYPASGGAARRLGRYGGFVNLLGWSADSKLLLLSGPTDASGAGPLRVLNVATGASTRIATGAIDGASFAPAGHDIVYARARSLLLTAPANLYVYSAGRTREIATNAQNPLWGPRYIVFARGHSRGPSLAPLDQLWSIEPDGSGAHQLTQIKVGPLDSGLVPVAFSADGEHLLADYQGTDTSETWTVDLSGPTAVARQLVPGESVPNAISRDGTRVLVSLGFEGAPLSLEEIPWGGGTATVLAPHGFGGSWTS